jgi:hypothetical protein
VLVVGLMLMLMLELDVRVRVRLRVSGYGYPGGVLCIIPDIEPILSIYYTVTVTGQG